jgi:hypothetical protein
VIEEVDDEIDIVEYEMDSSATEKVNGSALATTVDVLPEVVIGEEKENGDVAMCTICREMFSSGEFAKRPDQI